MNVKEGLVVCGDKNLGVGLTIWDIDTGNRLLRIPTCASPPFGLTCLRNQYLVASQIHRPGSVGGGVIFTWPLNKDGSTSFNLLEFLLRCIEQLILLTKNTHTPLRNYPLEVIGPLCCTKDGIYLAGGAPSGNIYIWEVSNGGLLKNWCAHRISLTCLVFSDDGSLLISGSEDGMVAVWSMITMDSGSCNSILSYSTAHTSFVTGLLSTSSISSSVFVSSSLDGTCKVWDLVSGTLLQTRSFLIPITAIVLDPAERLLLSGTADGRILVNSFEVGLLEDPWVNAGDQQIVLNGHKESITALTFCGLGLISASEDCTACLWDVANWVVIRRFEHQKGFISNMLVIPQSSLIPLKSQQRAYNSFRVSLLEKYPQTPSSSKGMVTLLPSRCPLQEKEIKGEYCSTTLLNQQILDLEGENTHEVIQMKVEATIENRAWVTKMTKHMIEMNKHLQSRLLDLAGCQLIEPAEKKSPPEEGKKKKLKVDSLPLQEGKTQPQGSGLSHL